MGPEGVFEWVVNSPEDIRPYGILVRDKEGADHRRLGELIGNRRWNLDHKPYPLGYFDRIPGSIHDPAEVRRSHAQAVEKIGGPEVPRELCWVPENGRGNCVVADKTSVEGEAEGSRVAHRRDRGAAVEAQAELLQAAEVPARDPELAPRMRVELARGSSARRARSGPLAHPGRGLGMRHGESVTGSGPRWRGEVRPSRARHGGTERARGAPGRRAPRGVRVAAALRRRR